MLVTCLNLYNEILLERELNLLWFSVVLRTTKAKLTKAASSPGKQLLILGLVLIIFGHGNTMQSTCSNVLYFTNCFLVLEEVVYHHRSVVAICLLIVDDTSLPFAEGTCIGCLASPSPDNSRVCFKC